MTNQCKSCGGFCGKKCKREVADTIASLIAELEEAQKDAARYRWLSVNAYVGIAPHPKPHEVWCIRLPNPSECADLDGAIDAAIAAGGTK